MMIAVAALWQIALAATGAAALRVAALAEEQRAEEESMLACIVR
jgi:hypothetical protein